MNDNNGEMMKILILQNKANSHAETIEILYIHTNDIRIAKTASAKKRRKTAKLSYKIQNDFKVYF